MSTSFSAYSSEKADNRRQSELRAMLEKSPASHRFSTLFGKELAPFAGKILEVFKAPKAEGAEFEFAPGTREAFLNLVDPSTAFGKIGLNSFGTHAARRMLPDDPGSGKADRWRLLASAVSSGISYREPGLKPSLHIAIRKDSADVHVDREGFINLIGGRVVYDPKQTINHLTADLASDYIPGLVSSLTVKDDNGRTKFQGTFAPWLEVNLPGTRDISGNRSTQTERIYGLRLFGIFEAGGG